MSKRYWVGSPPERCDICGDPITTTFVDGATVHGPWANMDEWCFVEHGKGLGVGRGQKYEKQPDGKWLKVGG